MDIYLVEELEVGHEAHVIKRVKVLLRISLLGSLCYVLSHTEFKVSLVSKIV